MEPTIGLEPMTRRLRKQEQMADLGRSPTKLLVQGKLLRAGEKESPVAVAVSIDCNLEIAK